MNEDVIESMKKQMEPSAEAVERLHERLSGKKRQNHFWILKPLSVGFSLCLVALQLWLHPFELGLPETDSPASQDRIPEIVFETAVADESEESVEEEVDVLILEVGEVSYELRRFSVEVGFEMLEESRELQDGWVIRGSLGDELVFEKDGRFYLGRANGGD